MARRFLILLFILTNLSLAGAVQYTVAYKNLAQTFTARHTFNPSSPGTPFYIGANAAEVEVADLRAEKMTSLAANGSNCSSGQIMSGIDANGAAESCVNVEIPNAGGLMRFPNNALTCQLVYVGSGSTYADSTDFWGCNYGTSNFSSASAASDTESTSGIFTTAANTNQYGIANAGEFIRLGQEIVFQSVTGMQELPGTNRRVILGVTGAAQGTTIASDTPAGSLAMFRWTSSASGNWQCMTGNGTTTNSADSGIPVDTSMHTFQIVLNAAKTTATFKIDGTTVCTRTSANGDPIPGSAANENVSFMNRGVNIGGGGNTGMRIAEIFLSWGTDTGLP